MNTISSVVFHNNFGNGDLHYSREYVKYISRILNIPSILSHRKCPLLLNDTGIGYRHINTQALNDVSLLEDNGTLFLNTWIATEKFKWFGPDEGCTLQNNHRMYANICERLQIPIRFEWEYIPSIDYSTCDLSLVNIRQNQNILVCNGPVYSSQANNFNMDPMILRLAEKHKSCDFYSTQKIQTSLPNVFDVNEIIGVHNKSNLNEISYLSTKCNIIIGRASGPYCFASVKENLYDADKSIICICGRAREGFWATMSDYPHITSHCKQIWIQAKHADTNISVDSIYLQIDKEITNKY